MKVRVFFACVVLAVVSPLAVSAKCVDTRVQSPNPGLYPAVFSSVAGASADDIWAVGYQITPTAYETLIEHWDGSAWSIVPSPNAPGASYTLLTSVTAVSSTDAWALGDYNLGHAHRDHEIREHWDGTAWTASLDDDEASIAGVSSVPGDPSSVWAVGIHYPFLCGYTRCPSQRVEHWNGSSWVRVGVQGNVGYLFGVLSLPHDTMWAVGYQEDYRGDVYPTIRHRAFGKWKPVSKVGLAPDATPAAVGGSSDDNVWIAAYPPWGGFLVEHWDGTQWKSYKLPHPPDTSVTSISVGSSADVWVAGFHQPTGYWGPEYPYLAHWDGLSWTLNTRSPIGSDQGSISGLFQLPTGVLTVGYDIPSDAPMETLVTFAHC